jgi:hypothetical protein
MADGGLISAAVEGIVDEAVVRKLITYVHAKIGDVFGKKGKSYLRSKIAGYNNAARHMPWVILVDLDNDFDCAPRLRHAWLPMPAPRLCFRIAVREIEAWLLADRETIAQFLSIALSRVPFHPEELDDPKTIIVNLARVSRRRDIRQDMVPRPESGRQVGQAYSSRLIEFVSNHWRPDIASGQSISLQRAIGCLKALAGGNS